MEIKFRAWNKHEKQYRTWEDILSHHYNERWFIDNTDKEYINCIFTDLDIILEAYTGLKDNIKKDIYEGDIVECWSAYGGRFKAEIVFQDGCFEIQEPQGKDGVFRDYLKCFTCNHAVEIIGNIHQNPELLED